MIVRDATPADIPEMVRMGRRFYAALGYEALVRFDAADFARSLAGFIRDQIALVTDGGMAVAVVAPSFVNASTLVAFELFFWMEPEKRGAGMALLEALEARARERGARSFSAVTCEGLRAASLAAAYRRRGYREMETTFVRRL